VSVGLAALAAGPRRVALDLRGTSAIDSTALGAIVELFKAATERGREVVLVAPSASVRCVLSITRLDKVLRIEGSMQALAGAAS
jgi:anti-sigma B factor antagonist